MSEQQKGTSLLEVGEITLVHAISAMIVTVFFRMQAGQDHFWQAGDESLIANGVSAVFDVLYWLVKPRILKWRNG